MKQIIRYELEQGDEALIYSRIPKDYCENCLKDDCDGCTVDNTWYDNWISKLKKAGVLEFAQLADEYHRLYKEVERANLRMKAIEDEMNIAIANGEDVSQYEGRKAEAMIRVKHINAALKDARRSVSDMEIQRYNMYAETLLQRRGTGDFQFSN